MASSEEELVVTHASLMTNLQGLQDDLSAPGELTPLKLGAQLARIRKQIMEHFASEEKDGWTAALLKQEPRLEHSVRDLLAEHRELLQSLDTLLDAVEAIPLVAQALRAKVLRWIEHVRDHESRESALLEEALVEDIGSGD